MDENNTLSPALAETVPQKPRFSPLESLFGWLLLLFGFFFWRAFPLSEKPLAGVLLLVSIYAFTFLVMLRGRCRFDLPTHLVLLSAALALLPPLMWDNRFHAFLCFAYVIAAYAYLVCAVTGNSLESTWSELLGADLLRAWFVFPFSCFGRLFSALLPPKGRGAGRTLLKIVLGLLLAVIPTAAALSLLSFDSAFTHLLETIFRFESEDTGENVVRFFLGIPVAMYLFGLYVSSITGRRDREQQAEEIRAKVERRRVLPLLSAAAAVLPLLSVYIIFFVSQKDYYLSAFTRELPANLGYADYAREGFFELCAVAALNFLVLLALSRYVRRGFEGVRRALCVTITVFTLVLIATAVSKLWLYVTRFGLSPDRFHAAWFMLLLTILFILVLIKQFSPRFKLLPCAMAVTVALFLLLVLPGSNRLIARHNVERFLDGRAKHIDIYYLSSLGDDAVPQLLRLRDAADRTDVRHRPDASQCGLIDFFLQNRIRFQSGFWESSVSSRRAERLLAQAGYMKEESPP